MMLPSCCSCTHIDVFHSIRGNGSRGACSISTGAKAVPCGCPAFTEAPAVQDPPGVSRTSPDTPVRLQIISERSGTEQNDGN